MQNMSAAAPTAAPIPTSPPVKHIDDEVEPSTTEKVPAGHLVHATLPEPSTTENVPAGHLVHATLPDASLYFPAPHTMQIPPGVPALPP